MESLVEPNLIMEPCSSALRASPDVLSNYREMLRRVSNDPPTDNTVRIYNLILPKRDDEKNELGSPC